MKLGEYSFGLHPIRTGMEYVQLPFLSTVTSSMSLVLRSIPIVGLTVPVHIDHIDFAKSG